VLTNCLFFAGMQVAKMGSSVSSSVNALAQHQGLLFDGYFTTIVRIISN